MDKRNSKKSYHHSPDFDDKHDMQPQFLKLGRRSASGTKRRPNNFGYCHYLDQLFSKDCFPDLMQLRVFPSAKDVSESMAVLQAFSQYGVLSTDELITKEEQHNSKMIKCLCIGDGSTPRTAVLACFLQNNWDCVSIDPILRNNWQGTIPQGVHGLVGYGGTIEAFVMEEMQKHEHALTTSTTTTTSGTKEQNKQDSQTHHDSVLQQSSSNTPTYDALVLLCVHSHARLERQASLHHIRSLYHFPPTTLIRLPCCPKFRSHADVGRPPDISYEDDGVFSACRQVQMWNFAKGNGDRDDIVGVNRLQDTDGAEFCQLIDSGIVN